MKYRVTSIFDGAVVGSKVVEARTYEDLPAILGELTCLHVIELGKGHGELTLVPTPPASADLDAHAIVVVPGRSKQ